MKREQTTAKFSDTLANEKYPNPEEITVKGLDKELLNLVREINTTGSSNLSLYTAALLIASLEESNRTKLLAIAKEILKER